MKKLFLIGLVALGFTINSNAQEGLSLGAHVGLPVGDVSDLTTINFGVDAMYLFDVADSFQAGFATGYSHFIGDSIDTGFGTVDVDDAGYIPLAGAARYAIADDWFVGADLGYAIGTNEGNDGGFYYQPKVGWKGENMDISAFYKGISVDGGSVDAVGIGAMFRL